MDIVSEKVAFFYFGSDQSDFLRVVLSFQGTGALVSQPEHIQQLIYSMVLQWHVSIKYHHKILFGIEGNATCVKVKSSKEKKDQMHLRSPQMEWLKT